MKFNCPSEIIEQRLNKKEYSLFIDIHKKISKMPANNELQRQTIMKYIENELVKNGYIKWWNGPIIDEEHSELKIWQWKIGEKICYVTFNVLNEEPANLIPSGVIFQTQNNS